MKIPDKNKILTRRIIQDIFNGSNLDNLSELIAENVVIHDTDKEIKGLENLRVGIANLHAAFPDLHYEIEDILSDNDKISARCKGSGTHLGSFRGIAATGRKMIYTVIFIWRFKNDKLEEHWSVSDVYGMLQQLQVIPLTS